METCVEKITPEIAMEYLSHNVHNRHIINKRVDEFVRRIQNGEFMLTHQGIAFRDDGVLRDGQHRLLAVVKSGIPVSMQVTRGLPDDAILAVDRGESRTVRDVITISGCCTDDDERVIGNQRTISSITQMVQCGYARMRVGPTDVLRIFETFKQQVTAFHDNVVAKSYSRKCTAPVLAAGLSAVIMGVDIGAVQKFYAIFGKDDVSGCSDLNVKAALNWRRQIDNARIRHVSIDKTKLFLGTQNAIYHFVNNTDTESIHVPWSYRYNVRGVIMDTLGINKSEN